jgi:hypothetical protein
VRCGCESKSEREGKEGNGKIEGERRGGKEGVRKDVRKVDRES